MEQSEPAVTKTPSEWFAVKFPGQALKYGCPFLELRETSGDGFSNVTPISINLDFFAGMLGGDIRLGHSIIYFEPEMQFYYRESMLQLYKPTSPEKLQNYYRAMLLRCAQELGGETDKLNLFLEFRSDKIAKQITNGFKSILAADSSFFSASSPHERIRGVELAERLMRVLCETMLERKEGACLTVTQAYGAFCRLAQQRNLGQLKRSMFRAVMQDLVRDFHGLALRRDVFNVFGKQREAWKGVKLIEAETLAV